MLMMLPAKGAIHGNAKLCKGKKNQQTQYACENGLQQLDRRLHQLATTQTGLHNWFGLGGWSHKFGTVIFYLTT